MVHVTDLTSAFTLVSGLLSLSLAIFAINAYRRSRDPTMAFVAGAFTVFMAKNFLVAYSIQTRLIEHTLLELLDAVADLATVLLLLAPLFWPPRSP